MGVGRPKRENKGRVGGRRTRQTRNREGIIIYRRIAEAK
jgi:hypothetical protein